MISIYPKRIQIKLLFAAFMYAAFFMPPLLSLAASPSSLSLSVTPTLFEMTAVPSQAWQSSIKVINNNKTPITVYPDVVNFAPQGEQGEGKFLPILDQSKDGSTLAEWITISRDGVTIPPENSVSIPISVAAPSDAAPGGHFAAILIGTKPPKLEGTVQVGTSQIVTSLFFVRIAGDIIEKGNIREFRVAKKVVDKPQAAFEVRFENKGNVYLQPQGEIDITNMWGKERGVVPINQQTHFGNVLPNSIRKFEFSWSGEPSFSDIGRYKAVISLSYGEDGKKFVSSILYFYVIPVKAGLVVLGSLIAFIIFARWTIKAYIKRMLALAGVEPLSRISSRQAPRTFAQEGDVRIVKKASVRAPVDSGVLDLKQRLQSSPQFLGKIKKFFEFIVVYKIFFASVVVFMICAIGASLFFIQATKEHRDYNVVIDNPDSTINLSSEEVMYEKTKKESTASTSTVVSQKFALVLVNSSDTPGAAASLQKSLESKGYTVDHLESDFERSKKNSVIVYDSAVSQDALQLSKLLNNALLSVRPDSASSSPSITVYIGNDFLTE